MKTDIYRKIEFATNISIMVVAALLGVILVKHYLIPKPASITDSVATNNQKQLQAGAELSIPGIDWAKTG
jgi:hypothetical protein